MAYNVIKGNVEFSGPVQGTIEDIVDDHSDQNIGGTKTFTQMVTASMGISASVFFGDGSNLDGVTGGPIDTYENSGNDRILTSVNSTTIRAESDLTFDGASLSVTGDMTASANVSASAFYGDGNALTNIGPSSLNLGAGLRDLAGNLELNLDTESGLQVAAGGLKIYPTNLSASSALSDSDLFITDQSGNKKTTALQVYNYVDGKLTIPTVAGSNGQIQYNDAGDLGASANLTFDSALGTLTSTNITASAHVSSSVFYGSGQNLTGVQKVGFSTFTASFDVAAQQSIVAIDSSGSIVTASLGAASGYSAAQTITFKDVGGSGSINYIAIEPSGSETIDGSTNGIQIQVNYGSVTISSDGVSSFYIVGTN
jgi:hypothetical protein